jgi:hypothetical protein
VNGLSGLNGLAEYQQMIDADSQATPEERSGNPADPRHGNRGEQARPYPWQSSLAMTGSHGPYGPENQMLGDEWWLVEPGGDPTDDITFDRQPNTRAAPFPRGIASGPVPDEGPDAIANQLIQSAQIHGVDAGARLKATYPAQGLGVQQDDWVEIWSLTPGATGLQPLPKQAMSSGFMWGTRDRTQSMARQNEFGYDTAHVHRRYATGSIPGNTDWMRPGGRPLMKSLAGPARPPIGPDSPFEGQDMGQAFSADGAVLQQVPREYVPPPQPNLAPAFAHDSGNDAVVEWY